MIEDRIAEVAVAAATAGAEILGKCRQRPVTVEQETARDVKLDVDRLAEARITDMIHEAFPDHAILAEESGDTPAPGGYRWIIDPLDGTVNYFYGLPYYCTSVACYAVDPGEATAADGISGLGRPVVGWYVSPDARNVHRASRAGATLNGRPLKVSAVSDLSEAIFCVGFGKNIERAQEMVEITRRVAERVRKIRCLGAAAYDLANIAAGRLTAFCENSLRSWDIAAGAIILQEAGGVIDAVETEPTRWQLLACAPGVSAELRDLLAGIAVRGR